MADSADNSPSRIAQTLGSLLGTSDLPDPPPPDPMPLLTRWYDQARDSGRYADFNAMTLATATPDGCPSARVVLCKAIEMSPPALVFFTNYTSRKGAEMDANPLAAAVFHWPHAKRQARIEGRVERVSDAESDAYFASRPILSRLGACISRQSQPLAGRDELLAAALSSTRRAMKAPIARPHDWGGYRIRIMAVELWAAGHGRMHDRIRWHKVDETWQSTRLWP